MSLFSSKVDKKLLHDIQRFFHKKDMYNNDTTKNNLHDFMVSIEWLRDNVKFQKYATIEEKEDIETLRKELDKLNVNPSFETAIEVKS